MQIGAVQRLTLVDYPGKVAAVLFTPGCNLSCGYCHNPELVLPDYVARLEQDLIPFDVFLNFLKTRTGLLDAVVISGGEPTLQSGLAQAVARIRDLGFFVKLDTNGTRPEVLRELLAQKRLDYVAMDFKNLPSRYPLFSGETPDSLEPRLLESLRLIMDSGLDYEFRTTLLPELHDLDILREMGEIIRGARLWALQSFRSKVVLDARYEELQPFGDGELAEFKRELSPLVSRIEIRGL